MNKKYVVMVLFALAGTMYKDTAWGLNNPVADKKLVDTAYSGGGTLDEIKQALAEGANVNATNQYGGTALMYAAWFVHLPIVQALLDKGANVNAADQSGTTALIWAIQNKQGDLTIVQALLDKGANVNAADQWGNTPLMLAAQNGLITVVQTLLNYRADPALKNNDNKTAFDLATPAVKEAFPRMLAAAVTARMPIKFEL